MFFIIEPAKVQFIAIWLRSPRRRLTELRHQLAVREYFSDVCREGENDLVQTLFVGYRDQRKPTIGAVFTLEADGQSISLSGRCRSPLANNIPLDAGSELTLSTFTMRGTILQEYDLAAGGSPFTPSSDSAQARRYLLYSLTSMSAVRRRERPPHSARLSPGTGTTFCAAGTGLAELQRAPIASPTQKEADSISRSLFFQYQSSAGHQTTGVCEYRLGRRLRSGTKPD